MAVAYFSPNAILDFYSMKGRNPESDYEILVALILNEFMEDAFGYEHMIGFHISDKYQSNISNIGTVDMQNLEKIIREYVEQASVVDIVISEKNKKSKIRKGFVFQLKRFGRRDGEEDTDSLIKYLNSIYKKYGNKKILVDLVIVFDGKTAIDFRKVSDSIISDNMPFQKIRYLSYFNGNMRIGEMWPKIGHYDYEFSFKPVNGKYLLRRKQR